MKYVKFLKSKMYKSYKKGDKFPLVHKLPSGWGFFNIGKGEQDCLCFDPDNKMYMSDGTVLAEIVEE